MGTPDLEFTDLCAERIYQFKQANQKIVKTPNQTEIDY